VAEGDQHAIIGSPAKWSALQQAHPDFLDAIPGLKALFEAVFIRALSDPTQVDRHVFYLGRLAVEDFSEIFVCCGNGYGIAGRKLLRGLYEKAATGWYLHNHPAEAAHFENHWHIQIERLARKVREVIGEDVIPQAEWDQLQRNAAEVRDGFMVPVCEKCGTTRLNHSWTRTDFVSMAREHPLLRVEVLPAYLETLPHVHASFGGILQRLDFDGEGVTFADESPMHVAEEVLMCAHALVLCASELQIAHFSLQHLAGQLQDRITEHVSIWGKHRSSG